MVIAPASLCRDLSHRKAHQIVILRDCELAASQSVTVPQAVDVRAVREPFCNCSNPPGDARLADTADPGDLPDAVAVLDIHGHQQLIRASQQIQPAAEHLYPASMPATVVIYLLCDVFMNSFHLRPPCPACQSALERALSIKLVL